MRHTVVLSDIHLCEVEPTSGLWMRYRQERYLPDREIAAMLAALRREVSGDELTLVLNGDVFDFDAPRVVEDRSVFHDLPRTAEHTVPMMTAILDDHGVFLDALGQVLADGHAIVFVSGNHDAQLTFREVRAVLADRLLGAALRALAEREISVTNDKRAELAGRVMFRGWFHKTPDGILIEHGNQYDSYCSFRYPMAPFGRNPREVQPTMGSLTARHMAGRMGYFNPHVDSSFMLSAAGYLAHWLRYYLLSRRSLAMAWIIGAVRTMLALFRYRDPANGARRRSNIAAAARETGAKVRAIARHARLFAPPSEDRLAVVVRELWLDRAALVLLTLLFGLIWLLLVPARLALGAALTPLVLFAYEWIIPKKPLQETWRRVNAAARQVARTHGARAVIFGHTHNPEGAWENGVFFGNTGSWSAAYRDIECTKPLFDERPLVWLKSTLRTRSAALAPAAASSVAPAHDVDLRGGLVVWKDDRFEHRATGGDPSPASLMPALLPDAATLRASLCPPPSSLESVQQKG